MKIRALFNLILLIVLSLPLSVAAQTTEFTYQGSLYDGGSPASGNYDLEFRLYDAISGGMQIGPLLTRSSVVVAAGSFSSKLDFGSVFPGADRYIEVRVKASGAGTYTLLDPRQRINSAPYAIKSSAAETSATAGNALQLGGTAANEFVQTADPRLMDARNPLPGSTSYIQNTGVVQAASTFNISGDGTAGGILRGNSVRATTAFYIGSSRVLGIEGIANLFAGTNTGLSNTGNSNAFFGPGAGQTNTSGSFNSFFGTATGAANLTGQNNSFFGNRAGTANTSGNDNSFFGSNTGDANTTGNRNSLFGKNAGEANTTANDNSCFGYNSGAANTTGSSNSFFGRDAGVRNIGGYANSFFGVNAGDFNTSGANNSFFGAGAGRSNGGAFSNSYFGVGAGLESTGGANAFFGVSAGGVNTTGSQNAFFGNNAGGNNRTGTHNTAIGHSAGPGLSTDDLTYATAIGSDAVVSNSNSIVLGRPAGEDTVRVPGNLNVNGNLVLASGGLAVFNSPVSLVSLSTGGSVDLCRNAANLIATCSSSLRYKTNIASFGFGIDLIKRLKPITFDWKDGGMHDLGLGAEDVAAIEPLLVTYNKTGQAEGVKYDRVGVVLVNAVKDQQVQIDEQKKSIEKLREQNVRQQLVIENLVKSICRQDPNDGVCKEQK
jgi:hypothetical protein